jgi:hypothetical protein
MPLENSSQEMEPQVERVAVEEYRPKQRKMATTPLNLIPESGTVVAPVSVPGTSSLDVYVSAFTGLGYALSARALLLLALIGGFIIALKAMDSQTIPSIEILGVYCFLVIIPTVILEIRKQS